MSVTRLLKGRIWDPEKTYSGSMGQKSTSIRKTAQTERQLLESSESLIKNTEMSSTPQRRWSENSTRWKMLTKLPHLEHFSIFKGETYVFLWWMRARIPTTTEVTQIHACIRLYSTMEKNRVKESHCCHAQPQDQPGSRNRKANKYF